MKAVPAANAPAPAGKKRRLTPGRKCTSDMVKRRGAERRRNASHWPQVRRKATDRHCHSHVICSRLVPRAERPESNTMFGKNKQTKTAPVSVGGMIDPRVAAAQEEEVRALLARGSTKSALELAKQIHKGAVTRASEALLVDAYVARIRGL